MCLAKPELNKEKCTRCGLCMDACTCHGIEMGEEGPLFVARQVGDVTCEQSADCMCLCEDVCPTGALSCSFEIVGDELGETSGSRSAPSTAKLAASP